MGYAAVRHHAALAARAGGERDFIEEPKVQPEEVVEGLGAEIERAVVLPVTHRHHRHTPECGSHDPGPGTGAGLGETARLNARPSKHAHQVLRVVGQAEFDHHRFAAYG